MKRLDEMQAAYLIDGVNMYVDIIIHKARLDIHHARGECDTMTYLNSMRTVNNAQRDLTISINELFENGSE